MSARPLAVVLDGQKSCSACNDIKPLGEFSPVKGGVGGRHSQCRMCVSAARYGLTGPAVLWMLDQQDGECAICQKEPRGTTPRTSVLHIDHDHESGINRGLLCFRCNLALGHFGDDPELLLRALRYLEHHREVAVS